jgi:hypothetical protein
LAELAEPCAELARLHTQLTAAFAAGDLVALRRLLPAIDRARFVCAGAACAIAARLAESESELSPSSAREARGPN